MAKLFRPPRPARWLLKRALPEDQWETAIGDFEEQYSRLAKDKGEIRALIWYLKNIIHLLPKKIYHFMWWRTIMFKNYLKTAVRNLVKYKGYSFINIVGLAIGITCFVFITFYTSFERSYDNYHEDGDRIFRVAIEGETSNRVAAITSDPVAPTLKNNFPQVEFSAQVLQGPEVLVAHHRKMFYEGNWFYANSDLFNILSIPFLHGNPSDSLDRPGTVVISRRMAKKYFGNQAAFGKTIKVNGRDFEITGVVGDFPSNTHFKYNFFMSLKTIERHYPFGNWGLANFRTYIKLRPGTNAVSFSKQIQYLEDQYGPSEADGAQERIRYFLQRVSDIHLQSNLIGEIEPPGNPVYLLIFSVVGFLILLIACVNFINLATARSANRAKEIGMRKVSGANRGQLVEQLLGETLFMTLLSLITALLLISLSLPFFNDLTGLAIAFSDLFRPRFLLTLLGITLLMGLAAGSYPALFLSAFNPAKVLKGSRGNGSSGAVLRKILVVAQFAISTILIIGTLIVFKQTGYMKNQHLGFEQNHKIIIPLRGRISIANNYESVKSEFMEHRLITGAAASNPVPGHGGFGCWSTFISGRENKEFAMNYFYVDHDFIPLYSINMAAGRNFHREMKTDREGAFIINEAAVKAFGWKSNREAIGKRIVGDYGGDEKTIIGVTDNFHYRGLQSVVEPVVMVLGPRSFRNITLMAGGENLKETLYFAEKKWQKLFPGKPFEYFFLDTAFNQQYRAEEQTGRLFGVFTFFGLFIACLGLLGLASFTAEQRRREIGVRKVLGSTVPEIVFLISKEYSKWILLANIITWPIAYIALNRWLQNFAYRTVIGMEIFVISAALILGIALLTVGYQSIKAALANPVDTIRYE